MGRFGCQKGAGSLHYIHKGGSDVCFSVLFGVKVRRSIRWARLWALRDGLDVEHHGKSMNDLANEGVHMNRRAWIYQN
jgi:hypothetical protein